MKRTRFSSRNRISADAAELARLAGGISESGGKLEDAFWESRLAETVDSLLQAGAEDDLNAALDRLFDTNPVAHDELADMVEARAESVTIAHAGQDYDVLLINTPVLAWSRYSIPSGVIPKGTLNALAVQLGAHVFAAGTRLALIDFLFSPDQLPRSFVDTRNLTRELGEAALAGQHLKLDTGNLEETNRFLSDVRYLVGAVVVPRGAPIFRWNEKDGTREGALKEWIKQGAPNLEPLLTGCAYQPLLADAYHAACRNADKASRPYSLRASVAFLQATQGVTAEQLRAVIGPFHDRRLEEYRIGFGPRDREATWHGVVWPLLGTEDDNTDAVGEIETVLRECGMKEIAFLDHPFPFEFCDDCGMPLYPNTESEVVHPELPEQAHDAPSQTLH